MSLFDALGNQSQLPDRAQMQNLVGQLQNNPIGFLQKMGYNIPNGIDLRNPNSIIAYLMQSKQINGGLLSAAQQMLGKFK